MMASLQIAPATSAASAAAAAGTPPAASAAAAAAAAAAASTIAGGRWKVREQRRNALRSAGTPSGVAIEAVTPVLAAPVSVST